MKRVSLLMIFAGLLAAVSCTEALQEDFQSAPEVEGAVMTKVINSPEEYVEGSLLVCLTDDAADAFASGDRTLASRLIEKIGPVTMEPVFHIKAEDAEVARRHNLHRWFSVGFEDTDTRTAVAHVSSFDAVTRVQYNTLIKPASDCRFTPYVPLPSEMAVSADAPFDDPMLADQWHYINTGSSAVSNDAKPGADIAVKDAWNLTAGDRSVIVAVIDGPVKYDHPDLAANMWKNAAETVNGKDDDNNGVIDDIYGMNCVDNSGDIRWSSAGESGHGTHVAGVVAAVNGNGTGVCGVAGGSGKGDGVRMMSCQIFDGGVSNLMASARAFKYAADNGACIAQCSFGYEGEGGAFGSDSEYSKMYGAEYDAIKYFMDPAKSNSDVLDRNIVIAAAGNESRAQSSYPAAVADVISVTGIGPDYLPAANYTNYGPGCNIAAPGGDWFVGNTAGAAVNRSRVLSTFINTVTDASLGTSGHDYVYMQGTSMACPHVSGVAALGLSYAKKLGKTFTKDEFVSMLLTSSNDMGELNWEGMKKLVAYVGGKEKTVDLGVYRDQMGTGAVDAWKFLMSIEGTPSLTVAVGTADSKAQNYDITSYFGENASRLTFTGVEVDDAARETLGLTSDPEIRYGKLRIRTTKVGSARITVRAIAGGETLGGKDQIGGMEISRTISILSRGVASDNGGWL